MSAIKGRREVIMAGSGGQGLVLSGVILAEAAIRDCKNVVQTVSYGIATRGGFSMAEVIIDEAEIVFQQVQKADVVLAMTEEAMQKYAPLADDGSMVVYDTTFVSKREGAHVVGFPFTDEAERLGNAGMANIVALGCLAKLADLVMTDSLKAVIEARFSGSALGANLKALDRGAQLAAGKE